MASFCRISAFAKNLTSYNTVCNIIVDIQQKVYEILELKKNWVIFTYIVYNIIFLLLYMKIRRKNMLDCFVLIDFIVNKVNVNSNNNKPKHFSYKHVQQRKK